jgi:hypothetical protein
VPREGPIATWPDTIDGFLIPVYVGDPSQEVSWLAYIDPNPDLMASPPVTAPMLTPAQDGGWVRLIRAVLTEPIEPGCHTIVIVVAYAFTFSSTGSFSSTEFPTPVSPPGGSVITWTFNNSGNPLSCGSYDAGALTDAAISGDAP